MKRLVINEQLILKIAKESPRLEAYTRARIRLLKVAAVQHYISRARMEGRFSATSPPRYLNSWKISGGRGRWFLVNVDPGALGVEVGAHAGGKTPVLKYAPLRNAVDMVASGHNG